MKSWKAIIEALGFHRWRYDKETHLHCMGFRKTSLRLGTVSKDGLNIPQDTSDEAKIIAVDTVSVAVDTTSGGR